MPIYEVHGLAHKKNSGADSKFFTFILFNPDEKSPIKVKWKLDLSASGHSESPDWVMTDVRVIKKRYVHFMKCSSLRLSGIDTIPEIGTLTITIDGDINPKTVPVVIVE